MLRKRNLGKCAVVAGLGLAISVSPFARANAATGLQDTPVEGEYANTTYADQASGESTGETKLYIKTLQDSVTTLEGSVEDRIKVSIPVAIHYVADADGTLVGPTDNAVKFVNHTQLGPVHVSKIRVSNNGDAKIVKGGQADENDEVSFSLRPVQGQSDDTGTTFVRGTANEGNNDDYPKTGDIDDLGAYVGNQDCDPTRKNMWNIAQKNGALALNDLTGKVGGFRAMSPATDYQAGTVHWTVRSGTRAQADVRDVSVTIHYHPNTGSNKDGTPIADQVVEVCNVNSLPDMVELSGALETALSSGETLLDPPAASTSADGSVSEWHFKEWNTKADGSGKTIAKVGDLGTAEKIAGKTFEVYAIFTDATA